MGPSLPGRHVGQTWAPAVAQRTLHGPADHARETGEAPDLGLQDRTQRRGPVAAEVQQPLGPAAVLRPDMRAGALGSAMLGKPPPALSWFQWGRRSACRCGKATAACMQCSQRLLCPVQVGK